MAPSLLNSRNVRSKSTSAAVNNSSGRTMRTTARGHQVRAASAGSGSRPGTATGGFKNMKNYTNTGYQSTSAGSSARGRNFDSEDNAANAPPQPMPPQQTAEPPKEQREDEIPMQRATVEDMLKHITSLGLCLRNDTDMFWLAEEAFKCSPPPIWSPQHDRLGRVFYYNRATGESVWVHPMHETFKTLVGWFREAKSDGGFWNIDRRLAVLQQEISGQLDTWIEQIDDHGEKFENHYFNKESTSLINIVDLFR